MTIVVVDLPEQLLAEQFKGAEVGLAVGIITVRDGASSWCEDLQALVEELAPGLDGPVSWPRSAVELGHLTLPREGGSMWCQLPDRVMAKVQAELEAALDQPTS